VRISPTPLLALAVAAAFAVPLLGCATPEELAAAEARRSAYKQTGTNIARKDHGNTRVTGVTGKDATDDTMRDFNKLPDRNVMSSGTM